MSGIASEAFLAMLLACAIGSLAGYLFAIQCGKVASKLISRVNQGLLNKVVIVFLVIMVPLSTGFWGIIILILSLMVGYIPVTGGTGKTVLCGCLIIPSIMI